MMSAPSILRFLYLLLFRGEPEAEHVIRRAAQFAFHLAEGTRAAVLPGENLPPDPGEERIAEKPDASENHDRRIDILEHAVLRLLSDEPGDTAARAHDLRDDQVRPRPSEQNAHVLEKARRDIRNDDMPEDPLLRGPQRFRGFDEGSFGAPRGRRSHRQHLEERADENDRDFRRIVDSENSHPLPANVNVKVTPYRRLTIRCSNATISV